ncbi:hypothetical protein SUGI_0915010 [Cryptomeria japonica]|nr:hypothetical protein SUGI_0915010 [Cryptomeria japonica]
MIEVIRGCDGVFHMACLLTDDPNGGVKRLVMTSLVGTVYMDPNRDPHFVVDENCWSDLDYCVQTKWQKKLHGSGQRKGIWIWW